MPRNRLIGFAVAAAVFVIDQLIKAWVVGPFGLDHLGAVREVVSFFDLRFVPNVGISLGLLPADSPAMRWGLVALTAAIAVGVAFWMRRETVRGDLIGLGLVLGGAIGNILDRIRFGYVVDYADLHFGEWRPFLVFNVADAAITIGVVILLLRSLFVRTPAAAVPQEK
ncbi:signal peptidase II [Sphingomonas donggukensis]|uniref:Lipoprotein signal peptidase n=1 Tax=Sphingomonas donggukensis TaxID=2949093 RepID=A0ABY4TTS5_9SPHN|nr:signal peptidase II [Sphingomonas donggukensis]URW75791.1 signal peptidase II [Sphingomonas donggukensis]